MHILPMNELRRQYEAGEITREYYEAMRATQIEPADALCQTPRCTRQALIVQRGHNLCAVCAQVERNKRRPHG